MAYREAEKYFDDFIASVNMQTDKGFSVLIVSEGLDRIMEDSFEEEIEREVTIVQADSHALPYKNRIKLLTEAKERHVDLLILGDIDDIADSDRIERIIEGFDDSFAFFYNDIALLDGKRIFPELPKTSKRFDLVDKNYMGMSNTALNMEFIPRGFLESLASGKTPYFDWYLFARMLDEVGDAKYIRNAVTYYRIHDNNIAGNPSVLDVKKEIRVKLEHYHLMSLTNSYYEKYALLCESLQRDDTFEFDSCYPFDEERFWWQGVNCTQLLEEKESGHV